MKNARHVPASDPVVAEPTGVANREEKGRGAMRVVLEARRGIMRPPPGVKKIGRRISVAVSARLRPYRNPGHRSPALVHPKVRQALGALSCRNVTGIGDISDLLLMSREKGDGKKERQGQDPAGK